MLEQADLERRAGQVDRATATLAALVDSYPTSPEAGLAAFTVGRLQEERGEDAQARAWFSRALSLGLPPPLEEAAKLKVAEVP